MKSPAANRRCLREPITEIADAARLLDAAVTVHLLGLRNIAEELIRLADMPALRDFGESLWGPKSSYVQYRAVPAAPPSLSKDQRAKERMPSAAVEAALFQRDGYHCRFCGIPVIRKQVRQRIREAYPCALRWGSTNAKQHAAFQLMWAYADHVVPHARGGNSSIDNLVIACAGCNFGRTYGSICCTLEEQGLIDPRTHERVNSTWDGLERFR